MANKGNLSRLSDLIIPKIERPNQCVYFVRIDAYNIQVDNCLRKCVARSQATGGLIDGRLPAPDMRQISYYQEMLGNTFELNLQFIDNALQKWMPRLAQNAKQSLSNAILQMMTSLKNSGKNENILKNAFVKYMCWMYYRFANLLNHLCTDKTPTVIYDGEFSIYELQMLTILHQAGCDVILLQKQGSANYNQLDPNNQYAQHFNVPGGTIFPPDYGIKMILDAILQEQKHKVAAEKIAAEKTAMAKATQKTTVAPPRSQASPIRHSPSPSHANNQPVQNAPKSPQPVDFGPAPTFKLQTNDWFTIGDPLKDILTPFAIRTNDKNIICNAFSLISGVENSTTYENHLYHFYRQLQDAKRRIVIVEKALEIPTPDEIAKVKRGNYRCVEDMAKALSLNLVVTVNPELQKFVIHAFGKIILEEAQKTGMNLNKITSTAVYLICWFRRFQADLFNGWVPPSTPCFIYLGACRQEKEALFLRMLSCMPIDVLLLNPDLNELSVIEDKRLQMIRNLSSLSLAQYPRDNRNIRIVTEGYQAERELDNISEDMGLYRTQQFSRAETFTLHTSHQELKEYWEMDIKDRPNFEIVNGTVNLPVLFAKVSGSAQDQEEQYWLHVKEFITPETYLIQQLPKTTMGKLSPISANIPDLCKNGKLLRDRIKTHKHYAYTLLRGDIQEHILDKIQALLDNKLIRGTGERNTDFMIIAAGLSFDKGIQRLLQQFDFTRQAPKVVVLNTGETVASIQDAIQFALLSMIGFDILFFIPSGYQCVEQWYQRPAVSEHYAGNYQYLYRVPNFDTLNSNSKQNWFSRFIHG